MKGDFTRSTFRPERHYAGVRQQQGRVQLDADWNEQVDIEHHLDETTRRDVIGECGGPIHDAGFLIEPSAPGGADLTIGAGRYYVHGVLCENEAARTYSDQPHGVLPPLSGLPSGVHTVYLDVWRRHVTALEDPELREVALGGPDTATRDETVWQVRLEHQPGVATDDASCDPLGGEWAPAERPASTGLLEARATPAPLDVQPCEVPPQAGYRRLENQLYRVQIHVSGGPAVATYKWSRDNGTMVTHWHGDESPGRAIVESVGRDPVLGFAPGQWVELSDAIRDLNGLPGTLVQLLAVDGLVLELDLTPSAVFPPAAPTAYSQFDPDTAYIRRWDGHGSVKVAAGESNWKALEDGVEVRFAAGAVHYNSHDYWMIPARTLPEPALDPSSAQVGGDILWPTDSAGAPLARLAEGIRHFYCPLAVASLSGGVWEVLDDCRDLFDPLTELDPGCCIRVEPGDDLQGAVDALRELGGGCICLGLGVHRLDQPLDLTGVRDLTIHGETPATALWVETDEAAGLRLVDVQRVALRDFVVVTDGPSASLDVASGSEGADAREVTIRGMTVVNLTPLLDGSSTWPCAVRLGQVRASAVEDSTLMAVVGLAGVWEQASGSKPVLWGDGVVGLRLRDVAVRFSRYGVLAVRGVDWDVRGCDVAAFEGGSVAQRLLADAPPLDSDAEARVQALLDALAEVLAEQAAWGESCAILALLWRDCRVADCLLFGSGALDAYAWVGGALEGCRLYGKTHALSLGWAHDLRIVGCHIEALGGGGWLLRGGVGVRFAENRVRARRGVLSLENHEVAVGLDAAVKDLAFAHGPVGDGVVQRRVLDAVLWELGLGTLTLIDVPEDVLWAALAAFAGGVGALAEVDVATGTKSPGLVPPPFWFHVSLVDNDIKAPEAAVQVSGVLVLGGFEARGNQLVSLKGPAVGLRVTPLAADIATATSLLSVLVDLVAASAPADLVDVAGEPPEVAEIVTVLFKWVKKRLPRLRGYLSVAPRAALEHNRIQSRDTAVASNLYTLRVATNDIEVLRSEERGEAESRGIDLSGWSVRVEANRVVVPAKARANESIPSGNAQGGIRIASTDKVSARLASGFRVQLLLLKTLVNGQTRPSEALVRAFMEPGALVADNEVVRGGATGIEVTPRLAATNVVVRGNQVRDMATAGLTVGSVLKASSTIGARIEDNEVVACGGGGSKQSEPAPPGGIVVGLAADCAIRGNRVVRCGVDQELVDVWGIDVDIALGLRVEGNRVVSNGTTDPSGATGGCRIVDAFGTVAVTENAIRHNLGRGLLWQNAPSPGDAHGNLASLEAAVMGDLSVLGGDSGPAAGRKKAGLSARGRVEGNHFVQRDGLPALFLVGVFQVPWLTFHDNQVVGTTPDLFPVHLQAIERIVCTDNQLESPHSSVLWGNFISGGVVSDNVANAVLVLGASSSVQSGLNVPPVVYL